MSKKLLVLLTAVISAALLLTACASVERTLIFEVDGETYATVNTTGQETVQMPNAPTKEEYEFDGWYRDKDVWEIPFTADSLSETPLTDNLTVYAKWKEVKKHEHSFGKWTVVTKATCMKAGLEKRVCSGCGEEETRDVVKLSHNYSARFDGNYHWQECSVGGEVKDKEKHTYKDNVCTVCGRMYETEGLSYEDIGNSCKVTGIGTATGSNIVIPSKYKGSPVVEIGDSAFSECANLKSVVIPNSVRRIGQWAFKACTGLQRIEIPHGVEIIRYQTFAHCSGLQSVTIPNSITNIFDYAFYGCSSLQSVEIPNSVRNIGNAAFMLCGSLRNVTIPNSVTDMGRWAFSECGNLRDVTISNAITNIGIETFMLCCSLQSVVIPVGVREIYYGAFGGCGNLVSIVIPESVTRIAQKAFYDCANLKSIEYQGKREKWSNNITKESDWNSSTGDYTVTCSDGTLTKSESNV